MNTEHNSTSSLPANLLTELESFADGSVKKEALSKLTLSGLPTTKWEDWKYTSINGALPEKLRQSASQEMSQEKLKVLSKCFDSPFYLVIYNGRFQSQNSQLPAGIKVSTTPLHHHINDEKSPLALLTHITQTQELLISIPENFELSHQTPLNLVYLQDDQALHSAIVKIQAGKNSSTHLIENFISENESADLDRKNLCSHITQCELKEQSFISLTKITQLSPQTSHFYKLRADVDKSATLKNLTINLNSKLGRNDLDIHLNSAHAHAQIDGLYPLKDDEHFDTFSAIHHHHADTTSDQLYKGVLDDQSRGVFTGKVYIHRDAQRVDANQLNQNILLSKKARINTRPQLEVYADDVKCAHGATIGQIGEEELFYLESRGVTKDQAYQMLCHAFIKEVIDRTLISCSPMARWIEELIFSNFKNFEKVKSATRT